MLKPSIKSVEGVSLAGIMAACVGILFILSGEPDTQLLLDNALKAATDSTEIAKAYHAADPSGFITPQVSKTIALLVFMYKTYLNFLDRRSSLKEKELMLNSK